MSTPSSSPRRRRLVRKSLLALGAAALGWLGAYTGGVMQLSTPVDLVLSAYPISGELLEATHRAEPQSLVILLHGLARGSHSMARLERALLAQGYEVWNEGYDSRTESAAEAAARIGASVVKRLRNLDLWPRYVHAVGHSMGGLVLRRIEADQPMLRFASVVCLGSPQRAAR
ncbi:MAG: hypothetical protein IPN34_02605 [Planctomycetes bacterium]|nr:hypothetical protein [Planctomycetota bacterium]